ncbi:MAG TPA: glycosyltransferase family 2 protein [Candidatus Sulfotelmatobacter sp.]|nr:glycosyltransferase family 2 protein [Candidatus Sulfotelmatobacter sp.]
MNVCALIPAFNEAAHIEEVVGGVGKHVQEVVLVDDGSCDGTAEIARAAGATCLSSPTNSGKASALRIGIAYACKGDFTHVLFLDGDGQHEPEDIPAMTRAAAETGADLVIGARTFDRERMPRARYYSNTIGSKIASWMVGQEVKDSQCGFRLVRMDKLRQLTLRGTKYELEMEILIKISRMGGTIVHVPVRMVYDDGQARSKMNPVRDTVRICFWSLAFRFLGV